MQTCGMACWMAQEDVCRCMCGGANHGILRKGGQQPGRFCQRQGRQWRLESICGRWIEAATGAREKSLEYNKAHNLPWYRESAWYQRATGHTLKWPEVRAFLEAQTSRGQRPEAYLLWVPLEQQPTGAAPAPQEVR